MPKKVKTNAGNRTPYLRGEELKLLTQKVIEAGIKQEITQRRRREMLFLVKSLSPKLPRRQIAALYAIADYAPASQKELGEFLPYSALWVQNAWQDLKDAGLMTIEGEPRQFNRMQPILTPEGKAFLNWLRGWIHYLRAPPKEDEKLIRNLCPSEAYLLGREGNAIREALYACMLAVIRDPKQPVVLRMPCHNGLRFEYDPHTCKFPAAIAWLSKVTKGAEIIKTNDAEKTRLAEIKKLKSGAEMDKEYKARRLKEIKEYERWLNSKEGRAEYDKAIKEAEIEIRAAKPLKSGGV
jgi:biotin operon repressor